MTNGSIRMHGCLLNFTITSLTYFIYQTRLLIAILEIALVEPAFDIYRLTDNSMLCLGL